MRGAWIAAAVLCSAGVARAQPEAAAPPVEEDRVSPDAANALSVLGSLASYTLIGVGLHASNSMAVVGGAGAVLAPSFGHWYAHELGSNGTIARFVGIGAVMGGALLAGHCWAGDPCTSRAGGDVLIIGGGIAFLYGTIYDLATAGDAAERYNARHAAPRAQVVPLVTPGGGGLSLAGQF